MYNWPPFTHSIKLVMNRSGRHIKDLHKNKVHFITIRCILYYTDSLQDIFNNVIPSTPGSAKCSFPLEFSYQNYVYIYHVPVHATCLSYFITVSVGSLSPSSGESLGETRATVNALGKERWVGDSRLGESASSCSKFRNVSKGLADPIDPIIFTDAILGS
jgi:hypothetical protein